MAGTQTVPMSFIRRTGNYVEFTVTGTVISHYAPPTYLPSDKELTRKLRPLKSLKFRLRRRELKKSLFGDSTKRPDVLKNPNR